MGADARLVERERDTGADHGDIHFGARNETQVGIARAGRRVRHDEGDHDFAGAEGELAGSRHHVLHRKGAGAARTRDLAHGTGGDQRRHTVGGGRAVAEIAAEGRAALNLGGADQLQRFHHPRPRSLHGFVLAEGETGDRRADADLLVGHRHVHERRNPLQVDDETGPHEIGAQLNQEVCAARERLGFAAGVGEEAHGVLDRLGRLEL